MDERRERTVHVLAGVEVLLVSAHALREDARA